ncbi:MAG: DUF5060 domain-containing protein [Candidatus Brocadiia bacterium]
MSGENSNRRLLPTVRRMMIGLFLALLLDFLPARAASGEPELPAELLSAGPPARRMRNQFDSHPSASDEKGPRSNRFLWEGFETSPARAGWSVDSAGDPARLSSSSERSSQGKRSMRIDARFRNKGWVLVRRGAKLKLKGLRRVLVDVYASEAGVRLSFAYKDTGDGWHQSSLANLQKGWNSDVSCSLKELINTDSQTAFFGSKDQTKQFYLVVDQGESDSTTVFVDNLRFEGIPPEDWSRTAPSDIEVYQPTRGVGIYRKFELGVQFKGTFGDLFDPDDALVEAVFTAPDGRTRTVRGFFAGYADSEKFGRGWPIFLIRFAPTAIGRWTFQIRVKNPEGRNSGRTRWFYVTDSKEKGFVRVARKDPRYFEFETGQFFYPIGQNVAWAQDYEPYFRRQEETGQNFVRVWLCPWNLKIEQKPGRYDLDAGMRLDRIFRLARQHELRIQLVLVAHDMLTGKAWKNNPYNSRNGGPCYLESEFFTDSEAKKLFKRRLDYMVARYSYSPNLFAWELFNEVDLAQYRSFDDVVEWHKEMSVYLKKIDPNNHLVTTSVSQKVTGKALWQIGSIDFIPAHLYGPDVPVRVVKEYLQMRGLKKPYFIAEYGRGSTLAEANKDQFGCELRDALWGTFMLPVGGNAMPWWWDSHIRPHNLARYFSPISRFARGIDRRSQNYKLIETAILLAGDNEVAVRGLLNHKSCYLWLHWPAHTEADPEGRTSLLPRGQEIALGGMLGGKYAVMIMECATGQIRRRSVLTSKKGRLVVPLVESEGAVAVKIQYRGNDEPRFFTSPQLQNLQEKVGPGGKIEN